MREISSVENQAVSIKPRYGLLGKHAACRELLLHVCAIFGMNRRQLPALPPGSTNMVSTGRALALTAAAALAALPGCQTFGPMMREPPAIIPAGAVADEDANPVYIPPLSYGHVFETLLHVVHDYDFEIAESNRYDGRIEAVPRIAPGLFELFRPGSPDLYDRLLETAQSYRHRLTIIIRPANNQGYFVEVIARKELEDLPQPIRSSVGGAIFRTDNNIDRQFEVIDQTFFQANWIFKGRDVPLEQELICRIKRRL
jgi:hypothetical protein